METQPTRKSRCPECGAEATEKSMVERRLSDMGYLHDDQMFECSECENRYAHGVPIAEFDGNAEDLWCDVCDLGFMTVHRVRPNHDVHVTLDLKCGHHHEFDCPHCNEEIAIDGVEPTKAGGRMCPHCKEHIAREDVPYCFYYTQVRREYGERDLVLVGYPTITGEINPDEPYGFPDDPGNSGEDTTE